MTITLVDPQNGTEVNLGESEVYPGKVCVTIFSNTADEVQNTVQSLADEYGCAEFTIPAKCADGKYGAIGMVW